jgi:vancomycin resistance protein YoaR
VFFGGFPVLDRYPHAYRVYYYEMGFNGVIDVSMAGLDATVYAPVVDFSFINDTDSWLLLETYVNPVEKWLTWKFYSTSDGRSVSWTTTGLQDIKPPSKPVYEENEDLGKGVIKQVDWAVEGATVTINRTVYRDGDVHFSDIYKTKYQPWKTVCQYGPGTENYPPPDDKQDPFSCGTK